MGVIKGLRGGLRGLKGNPSSPENGRIEPELPSPAGQITDKRRGSERAHEKTTPSNEGAEAIWSAYADRGMNVERWGALTDESNRQFDAALVTVEDEEGRTGVVPFVVTEVDGRPQEVPVVARNVFRGSGDVWTVYTGDNEGLRTLLLHRAMDAFIKGGDQATIDEAITLEFMMMHERGVDVPVDFTILRFAQGVPSSGWNYEDPLDTATTQKATEKDMRSLDSMAAKGLLRERLEATELGRRILELTDEGDEK